MKAPFFVLLIALCGVAHAQAPPGVWELQKADGAYVGLGVYTNEVACRADAVQENRMFPDWHLHCDRRPVLDKPVIPVQKAKP
jgi:hypothetical protein